MYTDHIHILNPYIGSQKADKTPTIGKIDQKTILHISFQWTPIKNTNITLGKLISDFALFKI